MQIETEMLQTPFPALKERIVLVDGPKAVGVYDLNRGEFHRVSKEAGEFLRSVMGESPLSSFDEDEQEFLDEARDLGLIEYHNSFGTRPQSNIDDFIQPRRPVRFAWIEVTSRCNQLCLHCFVGDQLNKFPHVPLVKIKEFAETLHRRGARQVVVSGGEPVLHPEIEEILAFLGTYPFRLSILSNASHPKIQRIIPTLVEHEVTVKTPILGWGESHDQMAGVSGCFDKLINNIEKLQEAGVKLELGTTVTAINKHDIPKIRTYANQRNIPLEVSPVFAIGWAVKHRDQVLSIDHDEMLAVCKDDKANQMPVTEPLVQIHSKRKQYPVDPTDYQAVDLRDYLTDRHECGQKIIAILANGSVTPCLLLREPQHSMGSVQEHSLDDVLDGRAKEAPAFLEQMRLDKVVDCRECEARYVCKAGGCMASAYALAGSVQRRNPLYDKCYYREY